ncbi:MAG TPA: iron ABC transporter permease [Actinophytocola sp.]|nr:iron ABC transporter permease [Actinophytocola sp.]
MTSLLERPPPQDDPVHPRWVLGSRLTRIAPSKWVIGVLALLVMALVLVPIGSMLVRVFFDGQRFTLSTFRDVFTNDGLYPILGNTVLVVLLGSACAFVVGSLFAWVNERTDARIPWIGELMPIAPLMIPAIAVAIGWVFLLAPKTGFLNVVLRIVLEPFGYHAADGPFNVFSLPGLILVYTFALTPYVYVVMAAGLRNIDPALEEAARVSGKSSFSIFRRVTLPAIKPSVATAWFLLGAKSLTMFSIPVVIGTGAGVTVLSVYIVRTVNFIYPPQIDDAMVLGLLVLVVILVLWRLQARVIAKGHFATIGGKGARASRVRLGLGRYVAWVLIGAYLLAVTILPLAGLVLVSLQSYWTPAVKWASLNLNNYRQVLFDQPIISASLQRSLILGVVTATVVLTIAMLLQWLVRESPGPVGRAIDGVSKLPAGVSSLVIGLGFIVVFAGPPFNLATTVTILLLAYIVVHLPEATILAGGALGQVGRELTEASSVSGAGPGRTIRRVLFPLMRPGLAAGWALVFVLVIDELTVSAMLSGNSNSVVGFQLLFLYEYGLFPTLAALATVVTAISLVVVGTVLVVLGRRSGVQALGRTRSGS